MSWFQIRVVEVPDCIEKIQIASFLLKMVLMVVRLADEAHFRRVTGMSRRRRIN